VLLPLLLPAEAGFVSLAFNVPITFLPKSPPTLWKRPRLWAQQSAANRQAIITAIAIAVNAAFMLDPIISKSCLSN
jgi:hypothetical protein